MQQSAERESTILAGAKSVCEAAGLELVEDAGLLAEVAGLVEHPIPLLGEMEPAFLDLPPEVITLTMKTHQKYFAVRDPKTNTLSANFVVVANQEAPDGGKAIAAGNARVLSARLADARHFWDNDLKTSLSERAGELSKVTFHEKLGTVADKVERVAALARELAPVVGADPDLAKKAARLAKADLVSEMVYEFPELQGAMGRYYALEQGEDAAVADAIKDHYKPQGPSDAVPTAPVSVAVALADKLDTLVGFWAIDEKPTGSKDPFALRRAALGVIRILLEGNFRALLGESVEEMVLDHDWYPVSLRDGAKHANPTAHEMASGIAVRYELMSFFADRLKVHLRDEGVRHDVIDAVFALGDDDLVRVTARSRALQAFLDTEDGTALLAGFKRASNILNKTGDLPEGEHAADRCVEPAEKDLAAALATARPAAQKAQADEDFTAAMAALAGLRAPIDSFFDTVTVNAEDSDLRKNRLLLLSDIRAAICAVADFNRIEG